MATDMIDTPALWSPEERAALAVPERLKPSVWAEKHRYLARGQSDIPGQWKNDNAPYLRGMMDLAEAPGVVQMNVMKAGQIGVSEALRNLILFWAHTDPDPMGLALPTEQKGRSVVRRRVIPAIQDTAAVRSLMTDRAYDVTGAQIMLMNGFLLHLMWPGSPASTASDPMRRVINDEVDKPGFRDWGGAEPNPVGRTWTRLRTFGDRKLQINVSTPTNRMGPIWGLYISSSVELEYRCPCPHCGEFQYLSFRQLRWEDQHDKMTKRDRDRLADRIEATGDVWYLCVRCGERVEPGQKTAMVRAGRWASEDGEIPDAEAVEEWPRGTRLGMKVSAMVCLWERWSSIAAEFVRAGSARQKIYTFRTETLGEPMEEQVAKPKASIFAAKCARAEFPEGEVAPWAVKLLATVDTQHDHFWAVVRAWGPGAHEGEMRSHRVWHGRCETFGDLDTVCLEHIWPVHGTDRGMRPELVGIDSGGTRMEGETTSRTVDVYRWAQKHRAIVRPFKGAGATARTMGSTLIKRSRGYINEGQQKKSSRKRVSLWLLNTHPLADLLADMINRGVEEGDEREETWLLNKEDDEDYNLQLSSMHKVMLQEGRQLVERWVPMERGSLNHLWDCEVYMIALALMARVDMLPSADDVQRFRDQQQTEKQRRTRDAHRRDKGSGWDVQDWSGKLE